MPVVHRGTRASRSARTRLTQPLFSPKVRKLGEGDARKRSMSGTFNARSGCPACTTADIIHAAAAVLIEADWLHEPLVRPGKCRPRPIR